LAELDRLARKASARLRGRVALAERLEAISQELYDAAGFHGNEEDYYDPRNSYLNEVLDRRTGIPITLAIVYIAVAARAGVEVYGVATPGHFIVGASESGQTLFVDPFTRGEVLSPGECRERVASRLGAADVLVDEHFAPASAFDIAARVLRNLKAAYAMRNHWSEALPVQQRLTVLLPDLIDERRDLGLIYLRTGDAPRALDLLQPYAKLCPPEDAQAVAPFIRAAQRLLAERN
jgi:regulator of sirC expression with transglutaminase-like and TPR domain